MSEDKVLFEKVYAKPKMAVWTHEDPPKELKELVENNIIKPCKVIDIGCGEGFYSIYLASKGFEVLGIDLSENAINLAKANAEKAGVKIRFETMDINNMQGLNEKFDFVLEWAIIHHIKFENREKYVEAVNNILNKNGKYLSMCFNENDAKFGGPGEKIRIIPEGSRSIPGGKLYFSSLDELKKLFDPYFNIIESKVFNENRSGKTNTWNYFFMGKK